VIKIPPRIFLLPFALVSLAVIGGILASLCHDAFNQLRAMTFASTQGVVDSSYLKQPPPGRHSGGQYDAIIAYHYSVANRQYGGNRVRYIGMTTQGWATDTVRRFAAGTHPTAFYNPSDPAEAVLIRGLQGEDLFMALFLTPFTMIMLISWVLLVASFGKSDRFAAMLTRWFLLVASFGKPARLVGFRILEEGVTARIRPAPWHAVGAAALGGVGSAIPLCLLFEIPTGGDPPLALGAVAWGLALTIGIVAGRVKSASIHRGSQDIVIDLIAKTLKPPDRAATSFKDIQNLLFVGPARGKGDCWLGLVLRKGSQRMNLPGGLQDENDVRRLGELIAKKIGVSVEAKM
jgi:hypothetical protein